MVKDMIDTILSTEQKLLRETIRKFAEREIAPYVLEWEQNDNFPWRRLYLEKMGAELGFLGLNVPEKYGGYGGGVLDLVILQQEFNRYGFMPPLTHISACCRNITKFGTEEIKEKYLPDLAKGRKLGAYAQSEPGAGTDATAMTSTAELKNGYYVLNGKKCFISNGNRADVLVVLAKTDKTKKARGISAFVVEKNFPGFSVGKVEDALGLKQMPHCELIFDNCLVPKENLLVPEGDAFKKLMIEFNSERCGNAASCLGMAEGAFERALKFVQERETFGKKLYEHQGIKWILADMAIQIEAARFLIYDAAYKADHGKIIAKEAAIAKTFTNEMVIRVTNMAMQLHGGYGYSKDYMIEKYMRDARGLSFGGGTPQILRDRIAVEILKER